MTPLPELHEATLDPATVETLFSDLRAHARLLSVVPKAMERGYVAGQSATLEEAQEAVRTGAWRAVQIRYVFEGKEWCDTLLAAPGGAARLVRISTTDALAAPSADEGNSRPRMHTNGHELTG